MTREEVATKIDNLSRFLTYPELDDLRALDDHDATQRQEIERLRAELDHWSYELFKHRESMLRNALRGILDIGESDMTNPKYDGYFEAARQALKEDHDNY